MTEHTAQLRPLPSGWFILFVCLFVCMFFIAVVDFKAKFIELYLC